MTRWTKLLFLALSFSLLLLSGGCNKAYRPINVKEFRKDLTPELDQIAINRQQATNDRTRHMDTNRRSAWDALDRIFLVNRTSRLTPYPVP